MKYWMENIHTDDFFQFEEYLTHHGIDRAKVMAAIKGGGIRHTSDGLTSQEIDAFFEILKSK